MNDGGFSLGCHHRSSDMSFMPWSDFVDIGEGNLLYFDVDTVRNSSRSNIRSTTAMIQRTASSDHYREVQIVPGTPSFRSPST